MLKERAPMPTDDAIKHLRRRLEVLEERLKQLEKDGRRDITSRRYLSEKDLARRLSVSVKLLQKQRQIGGGVPYHKIGGRVLYRLRDIRAYESQNFRRNTSES